MNQYISYYNSTTDRPEVDDGYYSEESDSTERERSISLGQAQPIEQTTPFLEFESTGSDNARQNKSTTKREDDVVMAEDLPPAFKPEQDLAELTGRLGKAELRYVKWKSRAQKYKRKIKLEREIRKSRKRSAPSDFIEYQEELTDGFGRPLRF